MPSSYGRGANMQLLLQRESTFRTAPAVPAAFRIPFISWGVGRDPKKVMDPSISSSPLADKSGAGDATVAGPVETILCLRNIGHWLSLLLGVPTAHKAVTKQPTNITGVTVHYAKTATPSGNGTLTYVAAAKTLTWKAQGDGTAGAAVNVAAGGRFTLASGVAAHDLVVEVDAATLAVADKTDADIAVSSTLKAHVFPFDLNDRPSALAELGHLDLVEYYRTLGIKVNTLSYNVLAPDQNIKMEILAGEEAKNGTAWDGAPTEYASVRSSGAGGFIGNGVDSSLGSLTEADITIGNNMQGYSLADNKEGYGLIDQGEITLQGKCKALFSSSGAYGLARASTSTRLRMGSRAAVGSDTFSLTWDIPNAEFVEKAVPKQGKNALFADLDWRAHRSTSGALPLLVLVNDVASY